MPLADSQGNVTDQLPVEKEQEQKWWTPVGDRVIIMPFKREEMTPGGLYIPSQAQEKQFQGMIIGVGPGRYEMGIFIPTERKCGEVVMYAKHAGYEFKIDGREVICMREGEILAVQTTLNNSMAENMNKAEEIPHTPD